MSYTPQNINGQASSANSSPFTLSNENVQDLYIIGQAGQASEINNILATTAGALATDVQLYRSYAIQVIVPVGVSGGAFIFEGSNDGSTFEPCPFIQQASVNPPTGVGAITAVASTSFIYVGACIFRFIRCRITTAITGGAIQVFSSFSLVSYNSTITAVTNQVATNLNTNVSGNLGNIGSLTQLVNGQTAHSLSATGNPVRIGGRVAATTAATQDLTLVANDASNLYTSTAGQLLIKQFSTAETDWQFACTTSVANTTDLVVRAASGVLGIRNYITGFQILNASATIATEVVIKDGATVIWRGFAPINVPITVILPTPLRGTGNTAVNFQCVTTGASVYISAQGYTSF